MSEKTP